MIILYMFAQNIKTDRFRVTGFILSPTNAVDRLW